MTYGDRVYKLVRSENYEPHKEYHFHEFVVLRRNLEVGLFGYLRETWTVIDKVDEPEEFARAVLRYEEDLAAKLKRAAHPTPEFMTVSS